MEQGPFSKELAALHLGDVEEAWRWGPAMAGNWVPGGERRVLCGPFLAVL